jgi:SAM-dependent methyltransferase
MFIRLSSKIGNVNPFDLCSEQYSRYRPDYPDDLIETIHQLCRGLLIDVGAGTGKGSAPFAGRGVSVLSLEPSLAMIASGLRSFPDLHYVCGTAEELPIAPAEASVVIVAQAFHWFDSQRALREFARVLAPNGCIALFWNTRDPALPAARLFEDLVQKWNPSRDPEYRKKDWAVPIRESRLFEPARHLSFRQTVAMTPAAWIGLSRSVSYVQSMGAAKLPGFEAELAAGLATMASTDCEYKTELWLAARRA